MIKFAKTTSGYKGLIIETEINSLELYLEAVNGLLILLSNSPADRVEPVTAPTAILIKDMLPTADQLREGIKE